MVTLIKFTFLHVAFVPVSILTLSHSHGYIHFLLALFVLSFFPFSSPFFSILILVCRSVRFSVFPFLWIRLSHFPSFWFFLLLSPIHSFCLLRFVIWSFSNFHANFYRTIPIFIPVSLHPVLISCCNHFLVNCCNLFEVLCPVISNISCFSSFPCKISMSNLFECCAQGREASGAWNNTNSFFTKHKESRTNLTKVLQTVTHSFFPHKLKRGSFIIHVPPQFIVSISTFRTVFVSTISRIHAYSFRTLLIFSLIFVQLCSQVLDNFILQCHAPVISFSQFHIFLSRYLCAIFFDILMFHNWRTNVESQQSFFQILNILVFDHCQISGPKFHALFFQNLMFFFVFCK